MVRQLAFRTPPPKPLNHSRAAVHFEMFASGKVNRLDRTQLETMLAVMYAPCLKRASGSSRPGTIDSSAAFQYVLLNHSRFQPDLHFFLPPRPSFWRVGDSKIHVVDPPPHPPRIIEVCVIA
jgi:hypothetical protein